MAASVAKSCGDPEARSIVELLRGSPSWTTATSASDKEQLMVAIKRIGQYDVPQIREALKSYLREVTPLGGDPDLGNLSKLFILNRVVFAVPDKPEERAIGWILPQKETSILWPLQQASSGLMLTGTYLGFEGDPYSALSEFNDFNMKYGPRRISKLDLQGPNSNEPIKAQAFIVKLLRKAPPWTTMGGNNAEREQEEFLRIARRITAFNIEEIRIAVACYQNEANQGNGEQDLDAVSKLFVLNRFIFNVPSSLREVTPGGWRVPRLASGSQMAESWPLAESPAGLVFAGEFGGYFGAPYSALREFDDFARRYGVRRNFNDGTSQSE